MHHSNSSSSRQVETLSGVWHALGPLELRRLILEGATVVLEASCPDLKDLLNALNPSLRVIEMQDSVEALAREIPEREVPVVCFGQDWRPAGSLANRFMEFGYKHVFTPETHWSGVVAMNAAGAFDQL
jgi:hypothetical protein